MTDDGEVYRNKPKHWRVVAVSRPRLMAASYVFAFLTPTMDATQLFKARSHGMQDETRKCPADVTAASPEVVHATRMS
jgi:hypothetical protein